MPVKWTTSKTSVAAYLLLAACSNEHGAAPSPTEAPASAAAATILDISGFKFLQLGMDLADLRRLSDPEFAPARDLTCARDRLLYECLVDGQTIAGARATVYATFAAEQLPPEPERKAVPPIYEIDSAKAVTSDGGIEHDRWIASKRARDAVLKHNAAAEAQLDTYFRLATVYVSVAADQADTLLQALSDRYGVATEIGPGTYLWESPTATIEYASTYERAAAYYRYRSLMTPLILQEGADRAARAGDL